MRESTRKLYAVAAYEYFRTNKLAVDVLGEANGDRYFSALPVQNYLFAELDRPCLGAKRRNKASFRAIRHVAANAKVVVDHQLNVVGRRLLLPFATYMAGHGTRFLDQTNNYFSPMTQSTLEMECHRRNLFVLRNLREIEVTATVNCPGCNILPLGSPKKIPIENEYAVTLEPFSSRVVVLKARPHKTFDPPVTFSSVEGGVLVFYVCDELN